jgi:hypothetical protein
MRKDLKAHRRAGYFYIEMETESVRRKSPAKTWIRRFGAAGFVFFLVKGLLWLIVPAAVAYLSFY